MDIKETCSLLQTSNMKEKNMSMRFSKNRESTRRNKMLEKQELSTTRSSNVKLWNKNATVNENSEKDKNKTKDSNSSKAYNVSTLFRRPSTIRLKIEEEHDTIELIREIVKVASKNSIGRIAILNDGIYHIGFKDNQVMNKLLMDGFVFKGKSIQPTLFDNRFIIMKIEDLPFNIESKQVIQVLSQYGKIICYKMSKYQEEEIFWLETGEMKIGMLMFQDIPKFLLIDNEPIFISYRMPIQICKYCEKECFTNVCWEYEESNCTHQGCGTDNEDNSNEQFKIKCRKENNIEKRSSEDNCRKDFEEVRSGKTYNEETDDDEDCKDFENVISEEYNDKESVDEGSEVKNGMESTDEDSDVEITDEYCEVDCVEESKVESAKEGNVKDEFKEIAMLESTTMRDEEADDDDSGYYLENSNSQSDNEHKKEMGSKMHKHDKMDKRNNEDFTSANDKNLVPPQTVKVGTFLDTISTQEQRSDFDCERVLVTVMDKIKDSLSFELGRNVNRNLLAMVMDSHNCWPKWYKIVQDKKKVNWNSYYFTISEDYRKLM